jgi:hypothetical protein
MLVFEHNNWQGAMKNGREQRQPDLENASNCCLASHQRSQPTRIERMNRGLMLVEHNSVRALVRLTGIEVVRVADRGGSRTNRPSNTPTQGEDQ